MFKEEKLELYCKLFCFMVFLIVIIFLNNIYSLLILFVYLLIVSKKEENNIVLFMYILTILGIALGFINNDLTLFKLSLAIDCAYYFVRYFRKNKHSFLFSKSNNKIINNSSVDKVLINKDEVSGELKKGKLLKEDDIELIKSHLNDKEKEFLKEYDYLKYLRFGKLKKDSSSYKWMFKLDDINSVYVMCHLLVLVLAIVVE